MLARSLLALADSPESHPFQVVESDDFLARASDVFKSVERWDEVKWSIGWALEIAPNLGQYLPAYDFWALKLQTVPPIVIYYAIDESHRTVRLLDLMVLDG